MEKALRRYFVCEGPDTEALVARIWANQERFATAIKDLRDKYGASAVFIRNNSRATALGYPDSSPREGLKIDAYKTDGHHLARPDRRTKVGREIEKQIKAASLKEGPSDQILSHYKAHRHAMQSDSMSRTGMSMAISVGHPLPDKKRVTLNIPVDDGEPFDPPSEAREIKKSEYIALTEES